MRDAVGAPSAAARVRSRAHLSVGACALIVGACLFPGATLAQVVAAPAPDVNLHAGDGPPRLPDKAAHGPVGEDGLSSDELYLTADEVTRNDATNQLIARGHVEARYQNHNLRAEELVYNIATGQVVANGHAEIVNPDGTVEYGEHMVMDDKLRSGVVTGFSATYGQSKVAAAAAIRHNQDVNELKRVVFTACAICTPQGRPTQPTWSIQAQDAVQDKAHQIIVYRNAVVKVKGVPIFWTPVFWTPDPTSPRHSGLLPPRLLNTERLGFSWEQPYLWVISPSQDLEIRPQFNTRVNPLLNLDYRKMFYSGEIEARVGYTYERYFQANGDKFGPETSHSYILATGAFNIDNDWRWGFSAEHSSDPTFFDRYDIQNIFERRGLYADDTRLLSSQLYTVRQDDHSYLSVTAIDFQSLRVFDQLTATGAPVKDAQGQVIQSEAIQSALPLVAPVIDARWDPDFDILNGRLRAFANAVLLDRTQASLLPYPGNSLIPEAVTPISDPCLTVGRSVCPGVSDQTATMGLEWRSAYTVDGVRLEPFLDVNGSVYDVQSGFRPFPGLYTLTSFPNATVERGMANLGLDISYPLYRPVGAADLIVEPMAELILAPKATYDPRVPNEDSQALSFDETTLFRPNVFPGYDIYQGGPRASVGGMATLDWGQAHDAHVFFGRQFNSQNPLPFPASYGLDHLYSDWITYASVSPFTGLNAWTRELFDSNSWALVRSEAAATWNVGWTHGIVRYLMDNTGLLDLVDPNYTYPLIEPGRIEEAEAAGYVMATRHWGAVFDAIRDLREDIWRRSEAGILYRDTCVDVAVVYQRNVTNPLGPSSAVLLRLNFPMSGRLGFLNYDTR